MDSATGTCKVVYLKTHVGHRNELCHLTIPKKQREALAAKIAQKIPFGDILNEVRDSVSNEKLERLHLLTRKDLHNIVSTFNMNSDSCRHAYDAISIDAWVTKMKDSSCVRFYKPQNSLSGQCAGLKNEDFMLIIMNETQCEILKKFGTDCICIDRTHGMNSYVFEIVTLMVIDETQQGFPCAFLICNRTDQEVISIFYEHIKKYIGLLKPNVFMSDMEDSFYNAWLAVMDLPAKRVYCSWHVDRVWRENLSKVKSKDTQIEVYRLLRTLLEERDISTFEIIFKEALSALIEDSHTQEFGHYFRDNYSTNTRSWAYCFHLHANPNTNMHLERMHKTIKYIYVQGHNVKRLDKCLHILMNFLKDRLSDRLIMLHKGEITNKIQILRQRHMASLKLDLDKVIEDQNGWLISSTTNDAEIYSVQENIIGCTCNIICKDCHTCIHRYICTCVDNSIKWNMCKHIHLICLKTSRAAEHVTPEAADDSISLYSENGEFETVDSAEEDDLQNQLLVAQLSKKQIHDDELTKKKQEFLNEMKMLVDSVTCDEELDVLKKCFAQVKAAIAAWRMSKKTEVNVRSSSSV
ncbi:hypothetical protein NQ314_005127 [Rhamnusium bicolor]|uniref:MULE transposase domain-containing protein n=1 Tax=Rhamnusium bicolor TaxID=1586634 RepID=A0AAV8ZKI2_9CUCU|nr:hypothetical protein NQ314_005127 [Rhamnusium bicolor]